MGDQPTLRTSRLVVRPFRDEDAPQVERFAGAREIADTTLHIPYPYPAGSAAGWISTHAPAWDEGAGATFAIAEPTTDAVLGAVGLAIIAEHRRAELGYWVALPYWNRGYATEAARVLLDFGFGQLQLHRIQARHLTRNPASGRVMEKLGMRREGILRDWAIKWERFEDVAIYAILATEWAA